ncbi:MAG: RNA polymerase sigma factor SigJ [Solirubrobacterales bacterium]|nr:RNA polymerase sigma factor SigJ [Solirubrobacterales bacterium]
MTGRDDSLDALRGYAFAVAYRMLGSVADAEDVVQEGLLRLHQAEEDGESIRSRRAYLSTVVTRLAIDELRSARARREQYHGEWLPEPVIDPVAGTGAALAGAGPVAGSAGEPGPEAQTELADSLSVAMMVLLESLSPEQRAAFLLHDVFGYSYGEVAEVVGKSEPATRQLATRARKAVEARRPRFEPSVEQHDELADRFFAAVFEGDVEQLESMLASDVELHGDGGGKVPALSRPITGAKVVAGAISKWGIIGASANGQFERVGVNGQPGAVLRDRHGRVINAIALDMKDGRVIALYSVANPDKISHLGEVGDLGEMIREGLDLND